MGPLTPLLALPRPRAPLSLPSCLSPSLRVWTPSFIYLFLTKITISTPSTCFLFTLSDSPPAPYWVLSTDYDNYALVYSCTDLGLLHMEFAWILSRQPSLPEETLEELHSTLSTIGVRVNKLLTTNQDAAYCSSMYQ